MTPCHTYLTDPNPIFFLPLSSFPQFRYKSRVYRQTHVEEKQIAKLHTKVSGVDKRHTLS